MKNELPPVCFHHTDAKQDILNKAYLIKEWARSNLVEVAKPINIGEYDSFERSPWTEEEILLFALANVIESRCQYFNQLISVLQLQPQIIVTK